MSIFEFDSTYQPAAPSFEVRIGDAADLLPAMLDTGADATFVPLSLLKPLNLVKVRDAIARSHRGDARLVPIYEVTLTIGEFRLESIAVIGDKNGNEIVLGRNVLNRLVFLVDGIGQVTELREALT